MMHRQFIVWTQATEEPHRYGLIMGHDNAIAILPGFSPNVHCINWARRFGEHGRRRSIDADGPREGREPARTVSSILSESIASAADRQIGEIVPIEVPGCDGANAGPCGHLGRRICEGPTWFSFGDLEDE